MRDYETLRQRHQAYAMALAPRLIERLDWPADRLALHRVQRLRELVREAIDRSPWHRERLAGIDATRLDEDSLRELPPMTKADLMDNFDRIVTDERLSLGLVNDHLETVTTGSYLLDGYTAVTSGGSTGHRGAFVYDWDGWATFWMGCFRHTLRAKWSDPELSSRPLVSGLGDGGPFHARHRGSVEDVRKPGVRQRSLPGHAADRGHRGRAEPDPAGLPGGVSLGSARPQLRGASGPPARSLRGRSSAARSRCCRRSARRPRKRGARRSGTSGPPRRVAASPSPALTRARI